MRRIAVALKAATLFAVLAPAQDSGAPDGAVEASMSPSSEVITPNRVINRRNSLRPT